MGRAGGRLSCCVLWGPYTGREAVTYNKCEGGEDCEGVPWDGGEARASWADTGAVVWRTPAMPNWVRFPTAQHDLEEMCRKLGAPKRSIAWREKGKDGEMSAKVKMVRCLISLFGVAGQSQPMSSAGEDLRDGALDQPTAQVGHDVCVAVLRQELDLLWPTTEGLHTGGNGIDDLSKTISAVPGCTINTRKK